jgi:hypothetical protein
MDVSGDNKSDHQGDSDESPEDMEEAERESEEEEEQEEQGSDDDDDDDDGDAVESKAYGHCQARTEKLEKGETQTRKRYYWARRTHGMAADRDIHVTLNLNPTSTAKPQDDGRDE